MWAKDFAKIKRGKLSTDHVDFPGFVFEEINGFVKVLEVGVIGG